MDHKLILVPTGKFGSRGERYRVFLDDELIVTSHAPEFPVCRVLHERGLTGNACFWRAGKRHWDFRIDIEKGATKTVIENAKIGPRLGKWVPYEDQTE
jgi:hypothetical protein